MPSVWQSSSLSRNVRSLLLKDRVRNVVSAGTRARRRFLDTKSELQEFVSQALKIRYETFGAEKKLLEKSVGQRGGFSMRRRTNSRKRKRNLITVSTHEDFVYWPFQGEYWVDELGFYRYRLRGECRKP